ncbi:MAG: hypothetical protein ABW224_08405 [Kibdelosporangium sp.]
MIEALAPQVADPADRITLDDTVRSALFVVLERLTAAERVAFVLHDTSSCRSSRSRKRLASR